MIETDLSSGSYDGVIISPLQSDTAAQLVSGTKLPIVAIDTNFTAPEVKSFVGTGNEAAAKKGGEAAVELPRLPAGPISSALRSQAYRATRPTPLA